MAGNVFTIQILDDGPKNVVARVVGILDTADLSAVTLLDPATLSSMQPGMPGGQLATQLAIDTIQFSIEDGLEVRLIWDATVPIVAEVMQGRGKTDYKPYGGLQNNTTTGKTGKILLTTQGWSGVLSFTLLVACFKQGISA